MGLKRKRQTEVDMLESSDDEVLIKEPVRNKKIRKEKAVVSEKESIKEESVVSDDIDDKRLVDESECEEEEEMVEEMEEIESVDMQGIDDEIAELEEEIENEPVKPPTDKIIKKSSKTTKKTDKTTAHHQNFEIFFTDMSFDATEKEVRKHFARCGKILNVSLVYRRDGLFKGKGFIKFVDEKSMKNALKLNNSTMMKRRIRVMIPISNTGKHIKKPHYISQGEANFNVIVKGLPFTVTDEDLGKIFEGLDSIKSFKVVRNDKGKSKGYGYVNFYSLESARSALEANGYKVQGRAITVEYVPVKNQKPKYNNNQDSGTQYNNNQDYNTQQAYNNTYTAPVLNNHEFQGEIVDL